VDQLLKKFRSPLSTVHQKVKFIHNSIHEFSIVNNCDKVDRKIIQQFNQEHNNIIRKFNYYCSKFNLRNVFASIIMYARENFLVMIMTMRISTQFLNFIIIGSEFELILIDLEVFQYRTNRVEDTGFEIFI
jgi:hypothetical protein